MLEIIEKLSTLGDNAIYAFIAVKIGEDLVCFVFLGLLVWGVRVAWKEWKSRGFPV